MFKRKLSLILAALLTAASLSACAGSNVTGKDTTPADTTAAGETNAPETTQSEQERLLSELPTGNFSGKTFNILNVTVGWADTQFSATELTGESYNDALYKRDQQIKDKLGIEIVELRDSAGSIDTAVSTSAMAQDGAYQAVINQMGRVGSYAQNNYVEDMSTYSALQLDKPWWNSAMIEKFNFGNKATVLFGDFHIGWATSHYIIAFSKSLVSDNGLEDPYTLMGKNEWTWDKMYEMMNAVARDVNGDGQYKTEDDIYGIGHYNNAPKSFIMSAEVSLLSYDNEGLPSFTAHEDEKYITAWEKLITYFASDERLVSMPGITGYNKIDPNTDGYKTLFSEGRLLFYDEVIGTLRDQRESSHEYSIMPHPKYDASQEAYYSPVNPSAMTLVVPFGDANPEMTGIVLENLCAYSHYTVMPVFVETTLHYKFAQDETSIGVLNTVLESNMFEIAYAYNWSGIWGQMDSLAQAGMTNITAQLKQLSKVVEKQIEKTVATLTE